MRFDAHAHRFILLLDTLAAAGFSTLRPRRYLRYLFLKTRVVLVCLINAMREVHLQAGDEDSAESLWGDGAVRAKFADVSMKKAGQVIYSTFYGVSIV